jgi:hypothetical protein
MVRRLLVGACAPLYPASEVRSIPRGRNTSSFSSSAKLRAGPHRRADQCIQAVDSNRIVDPIGSGDLANMRARADRTRPRCRLSVAPVQAEAAEHRSRLLTSMTSASVRTVARGRRAARYCGSCALNSVNMTSRCSANQLSDTSGSVTPSTRMAPSFLKSSIARSNSARDASPIYSVRRMRALRRRRRRHLCIGHVSSMGQRIQHDVGRQRVTLG